MRGCPRRLLRSLLGIVLTGILVSSTQPVEGAHLSHFFRPVLTRTTMKGGCCGLRLEALTPYSVTVADPTTGFSASAGHLILVAGRSRGIGLLWIYVTERNVASVAAGLDSGPANWLLKDTEGDAYTAYPGVPRRGPRGRPGEALANVNSLRADTNPSNAGWIFFHLAGKTESRFTLYWSDCLPRCDARGQDAAYSPVADVVLAHGDRGTR